MSSRSPGMMRRLMKWFALWAAVVVMLPVRTRPVSARHRLSSGPQSPVGRAADLTGARLATATGVTTRVSVSSSGAEGTIAQRCRLSPEMAR